MNTRLTVVLIITVLGGGFAYAAQYQSEVVTPGAASQNVPRGEQQQLQAVENNPYGKAIILQQMANKDIAERDFKTAIIRLEQALALKSLSGEAQAQMQYQLSQLFMASGQHQKAIAGLESHIKGAEAGGGKAAADAYIALGAAYAGQKQFDRALPHIKKAISMSPSPPADWQQLLLAVQCSSKEGGDCAGALLQRVKANPNDKQQWLQLSGLYLGYNNKARALAAMEYPYRHGLLTDQSELLNLAKLYIHAGQPYTAGTLLETWQQQKKIERSVANLELQAVAFLMARENTQAIAALNQAAAISGKAEHYAQIGQLNLERNDWPAAIAAFNQAINKGGLKTGPGKTYIALGYALQQAGQAEQAKDAFTSASRYGEAQASAKQWLSYLDPGKFGSVTDAPSLTLDAPTSGLTADVTPDFSGPAINTPTVSMTPGGRVASETVPQTGDDLTPVGAERVGNGDGSIPPWDGGITPSRAPASYQRGKQLTDPFPNEKPLFVITAANADQYKEKLTAAHMTLLKKFPSYKIPVYPTRRTASYPQQIYDATLANDNRAKLSGSDRLENARLGFPFRKPKSGVEIMWNHRTRYRGDTVQSKSQQAVVAQSGKITSRLFLNEKVMFRYGNIKDPVNIMQDNILLYYLAQYNDPGNNGFTVLAHETADSIKDPRAIWVVPPGLRRMFRIPPVGYDQPFLGSEAIMFVDMIDMYNGAFDRYVWRLVGKREFIVPYNSYRISDGSYKYDQLLTVNHFNQDATRYEMHRVWVIEATERLGKKHSFGKRIFYVDEDSWTVMMVDNHDRSEKPWRFQEGHLVHRYDVQSAFCQPVITYDLKDGRYLAAGLRGQEPPAQFDVPMVKGDFTPAVVGSRYIR